MKKEVMKKWVKALRSGKFQQGTAKLQHHDTYCCLGVLCKLAEQEGIVIHKDFYNQIEGQELNKQTFVRDWAKFKTLQGELPKTIRDTQGDRTTLAIINDSGKSFKQIAKIIEKYWRYL